MPLAPGDVFAGYAVVRQIGTGGMGAVYLVRHPRLPRFDALKLLNRELSAEPDFVARFMREADIVSGLSHRNIVSIYDRGEEAGQLWLTMRYVDGIDAEGALEESGGLLPVSRAVHIIGHVAAALDAAHRKHLIHRDVKPANILLCPADDDDGEQVFLTDFGIAKSLDAGGRSPGPASSSPPSTTPPRSRSRRSPSTRAPTSTHWAACSTSCSPAASPSPGRRCWPRPRGISACRPRAPRPWCRGYPRPSTT